jgi:hypothetical protein
LTADANKPRVFRTRQQLVIGWIGVLATMGVGVVVLLLPTDGRHGRLVIAAAAFFAAAGIARFAWCGVRVTATGVRVTNMLSNTDLAWDTIREFKISRVGACLVSLNDGRWVSITGIQQTNLAGMIDRQDTPERRMINQLNALLLEHGSRAVQTPAHSKSQSR